MKEHDVQAHNAITAVTTFYAGAMARAAETEGYAKAMADGLATQMATDAKQFAAYTVRVNTMLRDRQQKAAQALRILGTIDDGSAMSGPVAELRELLELMASEQMALAPVVQPAPQPQKKA